MGTSAPPAPAGTSTAPASSAGTAAGTAPADASKQTETPKAPEVPAWKKKLDDLRSSETTMVDDPDTSGVEAPFTGAPAEKEPAAAPVDPAEPVKETVKEPAKADEPADTGTGPVLVKVPGRRSEDADLDLPLDRAALEAAGITVKEARDRIAQMRNSYQRRAEQEAERRKNEMDRAELDGIGKALAEDPATFLVDQVGAKHYSDVARAAIVRLSDQEFAALMEEVSRYDADPSMRRDARADAREQAITRKEKAGQDAAVQKERKQYMESVANEVTKLIPEDMPEADADKFFDFAGYSLTQWANKQPPGTKLSPEQVPALLDQLGVLKPFGLALSAPTAQNGKTGDVSRTNGTPPKKAPAPAGDTAKDLRDRHDRRTHAATAPAGAGASAAAGPPKGQTFKDRLSWLRALK